MPADFIAHIFRGTKLHIHEILQIMVENIPGAALPDHIGDKYKENLLESVLKTLHITFQ